MRCVTSAVRSAQVPDASVTTSIYTRASPSAKRRLRRSPRHAANFHERIVAQRYPLLVAELDGHLVGWAGLALYSGRAAYAGIAECSIFVARNARGQGVGSELCQQLAEESERWGLDRLLGKVFPETWRVCGWSAVAASTRSAYGRRFLKHDSAG